MASRIKNLIVCIITALLLCVAQIVGNDMLLWAVLMLFLLVLSWEVIQNRTLPVLLFFLPWSALLRLNTESISFYTIGLGLASVITLIKMRFSLGQKEIVMGLLFVILTVLAKLLNGSGLNLSYIAFVMLLVMLPSLVQENERGNNSFYSTSVFFSVGIILAAFCAQQFLDYPNIRKFIRVDSYSSITRMCGFYADPNFYVAQVTAAVAGTLLMVLRASGRQVVVSLALSVLLFYCGLLSGSKSFFVVFACILIIWFFLLFRIRKKAGIKLAITFCMIVISVIVLSSAVFRGLFRMILFRFSEATNLSELTTGRTELWESYIHEMFNNPKNLLIGKGFTNILINNAASHNTVLQVVYQCGILGMLLLIKWWNDMGDGYLIRQAAEKRKLVETVLLAIGIFLPWMALDMLFFDEFFLFHWYFLLGLKEFVEDEQPMAATLEQ